MSEDRLEYCLKCGNATGKAGHGDGSLYCCDEGPFCEDCSDLHCNQHEEQIQSLQSQLELAKAYAGKCGETIDDLTKKLAAVEKERDEHKQANSLGTIGEKVRDQRIEKLEASLAASEKKVEELENPKKIYTNEDAKRDVMRENRFKTPPRGRWGRGRR